MGRGYLWREKIVGAKETVLWQERAQKTTSLIGRTLSCSLNRDNWLFLVAHLANSSC